MKNKARFQGYKIFSPINNNMKQPKLLDAINSGDDLLEEFDFFKKTDKKDQNLSDLGIYDFLDFS